ncbi:MAG: DUF3465 domain-containing protein [Gemmatimonadota bacterium]
MALSARQARRALVVIILVTSFWWVQRGVRSVDRRQPVGPAAAPATPAPSRPQTAPAPNAGNAALIDAVHQQRSHVELFAIGRVARLLPDDNEGSRHQKFLLRIAPDLTVLLVYNLDLARRVPVAMGDSVTARGEYIWNEKGGLLHWTHKDPAGKHQPGWVDLKGTRYQ